MKKIKVQVPEQHMKTFLVRSTCPPWVTYRRYIDPSCAKILKEHGISYDTNRGLMFFRTEEEATMFKLTHL